MAAWRCESRAESLSMTGPLSPTPDPVPSSVAVGVSVSLNARDAKALIVWMQDVRGFNLVALYEDLDDAHVRASRLELGNHAVHVSQRDPSDPAPRNVGLGVIASDESAVDLLYERATGAGAEIVREREHADTGSTDSRSVIPKATYGASARPGTTGRNR